MKIAYADFRPEWETLLFNNQNLGIHRFAFLLKKFPGLFMILISTWTLFGRGKDAVNTLTSENNMGIATLVAGVIVTITTLFGAQNHNNSPKNAFTQSLFRVGGSVLNIVVVIASIVFAAIALGDLRGLVCTTANTLPVPIALDGDDLPRLLPPDMHVAE